MSTAPNGFQTPKTSWQASDVVTANDFNRIESNIEAIEQGQRTLDPAQVPSSNAGNLRQLLDWFANRIKAITGKANWYDAPTKTMEQLINDFAAHLAETASKHIKESGSNPNGEYIRFDDGTQICWHTLTFTLNNQPGTTVTWTFPAAFKDNTAHVLGTVDNQSAADFGRYIVAARTKGTSYTRVTVRHINESFETSEFEVAVQAVGRWK